MGSVKQAPMNRILAVKMTREDLVNFHCLNNHVLLRQWSDNTFIRFNEATLQVDPSWKPEFHVDRVFTVEALPDKLSINRYDNSMHWYTDIDLKVGDRVWVNYLKSIKPIYRIECEGDKYIYIHYEFIYLALRPYNPEEYGLHIVVPSRFMQDRITLSKDRNTVYHPMSVEFNIRLIDDQDNEVEPGPNIVQDSADIIDSRTQSWEIGYRKRATRLYEVVMINGYILVELMPVIKRHVIMPGETASTYGILRFYGRPNARYTDKEYWDDPYIGSPEQLLHMSFGHYAALEDPMHHIFPWPRPLAVTQRRYVTGVVNPHVIDPLNISEMIDIEKIFLQTQRSD